MEGVSPSNGIVSPGRCVADMTSRAQERHGHEGDVECLLQQLRGSNIGATMSASAAEGGIITILKSSLFASCFISIQHRTLREGRVLVSQCDGPKGSLCVASVHMPNTCHGLPLHR
eukprot:8435274-Pyramimonas_sp.AAC.1